MGHQRQPLYLRRNLCPYFWKNPGIQGIFQGQSMYLRIPIGVILRLWLDEGVVTIHYLAIPHDYDAHGANAATLAVAVSKSIAAKSFIIKNSDNSFVMLHPAFIAQNFFIIQTLSYFYGLFLIHTL